MSAILPININQLTPSVTAWLMAIVRISSFFVAAPIFSQTNIPSQAKVLLSMLISLLIIPHILSTTHLQHALFSSDGFLMLLQQIVIGLAMGIILQMTFEALNLAGHYAATSMQLNFAMGFSPATHHQENIVGNLYFIFGMLIFIVLHGPIMLLVLIQKSFDLFPISTHLLSIAQIKAIPSFGSNMFSYSLLLALPVVATLLLTNLALAVMTRLAPSMNIFSIGFPVSMIVGLITITFSLPFALGHFSDMLQKTYQMIIHWQALK